MAWRCQVRSDVAAGHGVFTLPAYARRRAYGGAHGEARRGRAPKRTKTAPRPRHPRRDPLDARPRRAQDQEYPGTAFTRSIGDSLAESMGVMAEPELDHHQIKPNDKVLIVASDGIFEFITTRGCLDMALLYNNPLEACLALVGESYKLWIEREDRTDDITIIVGFIEQSGSKRDHGVGVERWPSRRARPR